MHPVSTRHQRMSLAVKAVAARHSQATVSPESIPDGERLDGELLKINSLHFVNMLIDLEDELEMTFSDDLFVGRTSITVLDLIDVVSRHGGSGPR